MNARPVALLVSLVLVAGCGRGIEPAALNAPPVSTGFSDEAATQKAYWTLFAGAAYPQVQIAGVPLTKTSKALGLHGSSHNDLLYSSGMAVDASGRVWVLSFGPNNGNPTSAVVFNAPITPKSKPKYVFVLDGTSAADALAFDPKGNAWVASAGNHDVMEYAGPFTKSKTLEPKITLNGGTFNPYGIAVDRSSNVYISINNSTGTESIAVTKPPYTHKPYFLNGLTSPGGLAFDKDGNLYASTNGAKPAVVRYNSIALKSGATPSIIDPTGLPPNSYEAAFAFTASGDLYAANCGNAGSAGINVWPLSKNRFNPKLAPSVIYTNAQIQAAGCAWGIAIK